MKESINSTKTVQAILVATALAAVLSLSVASMGEESVPEAHSDGLSAAISDTVITAKVKTKLAGDDMLKKSDVDVTTTNGVVTLKGNTTSTKAKLMAESDTKLVEGVKSVDNQLVSPNTSATATETKRVMSDSWITTKVKSELLADSVTKGLDVSVETKHQVVMLKGTLPSHEAIDHAKMLAAKVDDVKSVDISGLAVAK